MRNLWSRGSVIRIPTASLPTAATLCSWTRHFTHDCPSPTRSAKRGEYDTPPGRQSYPGRGSSIKERSLNTTPKMNEMMNDRESGKWPKYYRKAGSGHKFYRESGKQTPSRNREKLVLSRMHLLYIRIIFPVISLYFITGIKIVWFYWDGQNFIRTGISATILLEFGTRVPINTLEHGYKINMKAPVGQVCLETTTCSCSNCLLASSLNFTLHGRILLCTNSKQTLRDISPQPGFSVTSNVLWKYFSDVIGSNFWGKIL